MYLFILVAPETVKIRVEPKELTPGVEATLICDSSSSNPPAKLSWWKDGIPVDGLNNASKPGLWGGTVSSLELKINVTQDMNGVVYTCQSNNEALQRSVHEANALQVLCKFTISILKKNLFSYSIIVIIIIRLFRKLFSLVNSNFLLNMFYSD